MKAIEKKQFQSGLNCYLCIHGDCWLIRIAEAVMNFVKGITAEMTELVCMPLNYSMECMHTWPTNKHTQIRIIIEKK